MAIRNLYLSIYLTVVAVLLVFALVSAMLLHRHADAERDRIELAVSERTAAWAQLIEKSLPDGRASDEEQRQALLDWASRLRLAMALDAPDGHRIAASELFVLADERQKGRAVRVMLGDGRTLWLHRMGPRPIRGDGPPPGGGFGPGSGGPGGPDGADGPRPKMDWHVHVPDQRPLPDPGRWFGGVMRWFGPDPDNARARYWLGEGWRLVAPLLVLFVAIAAGSYPVVRRLTRRLERLRQGVDAFGAGNLAYRVRVDGRDEVAGLADSFNQAAQRIEDLVRSNRSLLANASHELRSPLARLKMAVAMMDSTSPEQRAALKVEINRDIRELDVLVDEVLLASRLDAQSAIAHDPVDLLGVGVEEVVRVEAELDVPESPDESWQLRGDERLLRRALRNLLENARRYGGDEVTLALRAWPDRLEATVCDRGPGVPEAERERIFEPFYRMAGHAEHAGGVGLGLSLVRQIARRHGGDVRCEAREGGGSRFVLTLPRQA